MVEHLLAKERVTGSNPVFRSKGDVAKWLRRGSAKSLSAVRIRPSPPSPLHQPKWRNRQTRRSQKPLGGNPLVGSTPTFGTQFHHIRCIRALAAYFPSLRRYDWYPRLKEAPANRQANAHGLSRAADAGIGEKDAKPSKKIFAYE